MSQQHIQEDIGSPRAEGTTSKQGSADLGVADLDEGRGEVLEVLALRQSSVSDLLLGGAQRVGKAGNTRVLVENSAAGRRRMNEDE